MGNSQSKQQSKQLSNKAFELLESECYTLITNVNTTLGSEDSLMKFKNLGAHVLQLSEMINKLIAFRNEKKNVHLHKKVDECLDTICNAKYDLAAIGLLM